MICRSLLSAGSKELEMQDQLNAQIKAGLLRRQREWVNRAFETHKDPQMQLITKSSLRRALEDLGLFLKESEVNDLFDEMDINQDNGLDQNEFFSCVQKPTQAVNWTKTLPLSEILADALPRKEGIDPLRVASNLSAGEIHVLCEVFSLHLNQLLRECTQHLKQSFEAMDSASIRVESEPTKFQVFHCGKIEDFHGGLVARVGSPNLDFYKGMEEEHCSKRGHNIEFETSNYKIRTCAKNEWDIVVKRIDIPAHHMGHKRCIPNIEDLMGCKLRTLANLALCEVIAVVLYTGPMFHVYNMILRKTSNPPDPLYQELVQGSNLFSTTIFSLVSAVQKIARVMKLPAGLTLYRGLNGNMKLPRFFFKSDDKGCKGMVEWAFMSTTTMKDIAVQYSGVKDGKPYPVVLEFRSGAVDRGACVKEFSQYPHEEEYLFVPCSFLEPRGMSCLEVTPSGIVTKIHVRVNMNLKAQTTEELVEQKKLMHISSFRGLLDELRHDLLDHAQKKEAQDKVRIFGFQEGQRQLSILIEDIMNECQRRIEKHEELAADKYLKNTTFRSLVEESLDVKEMGECKFLWYLNSQISLKMAKEKPLRRAAREWTMILERRLLQSCDPQKSCNIALELCQREGLLANSVDEENDMGEVCIISAAAEGVGERSIRNLIMAKADINSRSKDQATALMLASLNGHLDTVKALLIRDAEVNCAKDQGITALMWAAQGGHCAIIRALTQKNAALDVKDVHDRTALMIAATWDHGKTVKTLLAERANIDENEQGKATLLIAAQRGLTDVVQLLYSAGVSINSPNNVGQTALMIAIENQQWETVSAILNFQPGPDVNRIDQNKSSALLFAAEHGHVQSVETLLKMKANVNQSRKEDENTPLIVASINNRLDVVKMLGRAGANMNACDKKHRTALYLAAFFGFIEIVKTLHTMGADLDTPNETGLSASLFAGQQKDYEKVKALLALKSDVNRCTREGINLLMMAAQSGNTDTTSFILKCGADVNAVDLTGSAALSMAAKCGSCECVRVLHAAKADIEAKNHHGSTPLMMAASEGHSETVQVLLDLGADVNIHDKENASALHRACTSGCYNACTYLLSAGAHVNATNLRLATPLMLASSGGHISIVEALISSKADLNARNDAQSTSLLWAARSGQTNVVKVLHSAGSPLNDADKNGKTALISAANFGHHETVAILHELGEDINRADLSGMTALMWASRFGHIETVRVLCRLGATINARDMTGTSAITWAARTPHREIVSKLLELGAESTDVEIAMLSTVPVSQVVPKVFLQPQIVVPTSNSYTPEENTRIKTKYTIGCILSDEEFCRVNTHESNYFRFQVSDLVGITRSNGTTTVGQVLSIDVDSTITVAVEVDDRNQVRITKKSPDSSLFFKLLVHQVGQLLHDSQVQRGKFSFRCGDLVGLLRSNGTITIVEIASLSADGAIVIWIQKGRSLAEWISKVVLPGDVERLLFKIST